LDAENAGIALFTDGVSCPAEESAVILLFILVDSMCDITLPSGCGNGTVGHFGHCQSRVEHPAEAQIGGWMGVDGTSNRHRFITRRSVSRLLTWLAMGSNCVNPIDNHAKRLKKNSFLLYKT
jgi:hypothetical protein